MALLTKLLTSTSLKAMCLFWFLLHSTLKCAFIFVIMGYAPQPYYYVPLDAVGDRLFSIRESDHVLQLHIALTHEHHSHQMWAVDLIYPDLSYCWNSRQWRSVLDSFQYQFDQKLNLLDLFSMLIRTTEPDLEGNCLIVAWSPFMWICLYFSTHLLMLFL